MGLIQRINVPLSDKYRLKYENKLKELDDLKKTIGTEYFPDDPQKEIEEIEEKEKDICELLGYDDYIKSKDIEKE